jgi:DNA-binding Lrp family transcriptional regulator
MRMRLLRAVRVKPHSSGAARRTLANAPQNPAHWRKTLAPDTAVTQSSATLDRYDRALLQVLQSEGRITNSELAARVHLSESACLRRVRALETAGLIEGYAAVINQQRAGCPVNVFVSITLERQERADLRTFEEAVRKVPEVMECYLMSGEYDFLLRVVVADTADFERVHSQHLTSLPHVARVHSSFALRTVQKSRELPIR